MFKSMLDQKITDEQVDNERFTLYMDEMLRNYVGSILTGLPIYYFIYQLQPYLSSNAFIVWFSLIAILSVSVFITYVGFYKFYDKFDLSTWKTLSYIPLIIFSLQISAAPWLFLNSETDIFLYTMIIMIASLTGTIAYAIAYYFERQVLFTALPLLSMAVKFSTMDSGNPYIIYGVIVFLLVSSLLFSHQIYKSLTNSITLKLEHIQARDAAERLNTEKSRFLAAASHDIRQPLQAINFFVNTLKSKNSIKEDEVVLDRLEKSVDSMSDLLNSLLDVSKLDAQVVEPRPNHIYLMTVLNKLKVLFESAAKAKGIKLIVEGEQCIVFADVILLEQVVSNLLSNAIRYTYSGTITLTVEHLSNKINIYVKDTGVGISSNDQDSIFLEFYQLNNPERDQNKGLGLGLSIVKRLCKLQDWPLTLSSTLGEGSCFGFCVPLGKKELIFEPECLDINRNLDMLDIIVIDDNSDIRFSLSNILNDWGCNVRTFETAECACEAVKQLDDWEPNLIISDYRLRDNKTGVEAIKQVETLYQRPLETIILSGDTAPERIKEAEDSGVTILHKPIKPAKLRVALYQKSRRITDRAY